LGAYAARWSVAIGAVLVALGCDAGSERLNETADSRAGDGAGHAGAGQGDGREVDAGPIDGGLHLTIDSLAYGGGRFVAVGSEAELIGDTWGDSWGVIYVSQDGATWTRAATDLPTPVWDISYGNGRFVALGSDIQNGSGAATMFSRAYVSDEGEHWTTVDLVEPLISVHAAFGAGLFIAAGETAHWRSVDGVSWTAFGPPSGISGGVDFADGAFVSWGSSSPSLLVSIGGGEWSATTLDEPGLRIAELTVVNDRFVGVAVSGYGEAGNPLSWRETSSDDGVHWSLGRATQTRPPLTAIEDDSVCIALGAEAVYSGPDCASLEVTYTASSFVPTSALHAGGLYLVGGESGGILSSLDGITWTKALWE
jgi:hypothetical protein